MKLFSLLLMLTLAACSEPKIDCAVQEVEGIPGQLILIVEGNEEVTDMLVATPIDRDSYKRFGERKFIFVWPTGLPIYPTLFFLVNGKELHFIPQLKADDFQTRSKDPV